MDQSGSLDQARDFLIEALGKQSAFWGLGKAAGEIYGVLYVSPGPLTLGEIAGSLKVTKGSVSMAVRNLERLGMVRRFFKRGDRKVYFEAETDFWKMTRTILEQRQKPEFDHSFRLVEKSLGLAKGSPVTEERNEVVKRLEHLKHFYSVLDSIVALALRLDPEQVPGLAALLAGVPGAKPEKIKEGSP